VELCRARPTAIDLFAGVGGMSLGFEQAGFDVLAAVEYDPVHAASHRYNFPLTETLCRDARRVSGKDLLDAAARGWRNHGRHGEWVGSVDVVFGGPSCQGFSVIGQRSADDDRNRLLNEFVRLVEEISPRAFCLENVPGMLEDRFADIRNGAFRRLRNAGYKIAGNTEPVNAMDFGVPQNRRRILVFGLRDTGPQALLPTVSKPLTVSDAFEGLAEPSNYEELRNRDWVRLRPEDTKKRRQTMGTYARYLSSLDRDPDDRSRHRQWNHLQLTNSLLTNHSIESMTRFVNTPPGTAEPVSHYFKLSPDGPARTLRAGTGRERGAFTSPRPIHPTEPRVITAREAARLHSFPDWFRFNITNWHGHRQIGNSVPPLLARAAGNSISRSLGHSPVRAWQFLDSQDEMLLSLSMGEAKDVVMSELPPRRTNRKRNLAQSEVQVAGRRFGSN
jgi:DNA (cytosine-5)-methyltransferase 1